MPVKQAREGTCVASSEAARLGGRCNRTYDWSVANRSPETEGKRGGRKRGPKGTATQKYRRDLAIYRGWLEGRSAAALAREHDLSDRQARAIVRGMKEAAKPARDPSPEEVVERVLAHAEEAIGDLYSTGKELSGAARVGAIGARLRALNGYFTLLEKSGRVPSGPMQWRTERDVARVIEVVLHVFDRYGVPVGARREIRDLLDGRGRAPEAG